jgi:hypothetical protein
MSPTCVEVARRRPPSGPAQARPFVALAMVLLWLVGAGAMARAEPAGSLSRQEIAAVLGRIAADTRRLSVTTLEAVLLPEAEIAVQTSATGALQSLRYSKAEYLDVARKVFASLEAENIRYTYEDEPPDIRLAADGRTAIVVGTTREHFAFPDGRTMTTITRATLHFVWQDGGARVERVQAIDQTPPPTMR